MTIIEAIENARDYLRDNFGGGVELEDDLTLVASRLRRKYPHIAEEKLHHIDEVLSKAKQPTDR
jgi:hypothetical protein